MWRVTGLCALGLSNALLLVWGSDASPARQLFAVLAGAGIGGAALLWVALDRRFAQMQVVSVLALGLLLRLVAVQASPLLEDDHYRYLWDGWRSATALDPYRQPPSAYFGAPGLSAHWNDILGGINNPDTPTIYGPVLQWLFALAHQIAPGRIGALQALLLLADMLVLGVLAWQGVGSRLLLLYALHPLVLKEVMASAHPDGLVALWLLLALLAWQRQRALWLGLVLGFAVCTKVAALVVVPMLLLPPAPAAGEQKKHRVIVWLGSVTGAFGLTLLALYAPFVWAGGSDAAALRVFGSEWRFNPLLYRCVEILLPTALARPAAAVLIGLAVAALTWRWRCRLRSPAGHHVPPLDSGFLVLLLLSPVLNPWYWLWALALSVRRSRTGLVLACLASTLAYCNSSVLGEAAATALGAAALPFAVPWPMALVQIVALLAALVIGALGVSAAVPAASRAVLGSRRRRV
jgi:alpha-1,6-mannosyltransferase